MTFKLSHGDASGFKFLLFLAITYGLMSILAYCIVQMKFIRPLGMDAPLDRFSEARAVEHVRVLSKEIDGRQEGRPGLREAARYIKVQLESLKDRASSNVRIEVEENTVNGSFTMMFLGHSITLAYRDHVNVIARISSVDSKDTDPSVLVNGHFDSPLGSPGAADCGSCVASMLELARLVVDSGWSPPRPVILLFNGAEELFMLGAHGFMKTYKWRDTIGASINVEASGAGGPDLVCQSGPGSWPSHVYAQSAVYPMAHSAAQDVFPVIPGDTDYRIFSQDYGSIPGLDIIFLLGGYFYHTSYDTVERLLPGSIQARGENLYSLIKAFTNSSRLQTVKERDSGLAIANNHKDDRAIFFDYLSWFMIIYSRKVAEVLHSIPLVVFFVMPFILSFRQKSRSWLTTLYDFVKGILLHASVIFLGVAFPIIFSVLRLLFSSQAMNWFTHPFLAFMMFVPCSLLGLLILGIIFKRFPLSQDVSVLNTSKEALRNEARFWGAFGFYAMLTMVYLVSGLSGGFLTFLLAASMLPAWMLYCLSAKSYGQESLRPILFYMFSLIPWLAYSVYFGGFLVQFLIEKMGMMGALPEPYGYFVPDIVVAAVVGFVTGWCVGPLIPLCTRFLARPSILGFLLHFTVIALALSSQFFPYSMDAPKRVVFQVTFRTAGGNQIMESTYDFSVVDSNSLQFLFNYAPEVAKELEISSDFSFESATVSHQDTWTALFPVNFLFSRSLKFPAKVDDSSRHYKSLPHISIQNQHSQSTNGQRRVFLELSLGSLEEVWVAVMNVTGPLSNWSIADNILPDPERLDGGPPSYICRFSGASHENWTFWLEAGSSEDIRVELTVLDQKLVPAADRLKRLFPNWVDVTAYSSFLSTYIL